MSNNPCNYVDYGGGDH